MINPKDIDRLHQRLDAQPEEPGTPLLDCLIDWEGPMWCSGYEWVWCDRTQQYRKPVEDVALLEQCLKELKAFRAEIEQKVKPEKLRSQGLADKDKQIAYIEQRIFTLRKANPRPKRGRPRGKASGSLSPIVERRKGKTYPIVPGERVPKDLAFDYPHQFNWLYQWSEWCPRREKWVTKSKRVPHTKIYMVRWHIGQGYPVKDILNYINGA